MRLAALLVCSFLAVLASPVRAAQLASCSAGVTTCSNDTTNDAAIVNAINDPVFEQRVFWLWLQQCNNIYSESVATNGHVQRVAFCQTIAHDSGPSQGNAVPLPLLVGAIINSTVESEILAGSGAPAGGNAVDADINTAIDAALTVSGTPVSTTATQATVGLNYFTVASATGIAIGMTCAGPGIPANAIVSNVSSTTVTITGNTSSAMSASPVSCVTLSGLAAKW